MAIKPGKYTPYNISDINMLPEYKDGKRVFRGTGGDGTQESENVIYITHLGLSRMIALKAFLESYKLNLSKEVKFFQEADKNDKPLSEYVSDIGYSITLNIPAHSVNESRNNTAKLEELQRLISPMGSSTERHPTYGTPNSLFSVWFKNLISSGEYYSGYPSPSGITIDNALKNGFLCYIEKVDFVPDIEAGFFDYDEGAGGTRRKFLFPKNIKLQLELKYGAQPSGEFRQKLMGKGVGIGEPACGFDLDGQYTLMDNGGWPFGLGIYTANKGERISRKKDFDTDNMNKIRTSYSSTNSYLFISMQNDNDNGLSRKRWLLFEPFVDSFNRNYEINYPKIEGDVGREVGKPINMDAQSTFKTLDYSFKINVPAASLADAKRNMAKIQYLSRMFFKKFEPSNKDINKRVKSQKLKFYMPSFIEKAGATKSQPHNFKGMFGNAIDLVLLNISIDFDLEQGFFEQGGKLYPKAYSIDFQTTSDDAYSITNYKLVGNNYGMLEGSNKGKEELFPFNRKTSTIKIGR